MKSNMSDIRYDLWITVLIIFEDHFCLIDTYHLTVNTDPKFLITRSENLLFYIRKLSNFFFYIFIVFLLSFDSCFDVKINLNSKTESKILSTKSHYYYIKKYKTNSFSGSVCEVCALTSLYLFIFILSLLSFVELNKNIVFC